MKVDWPAEYTYASVANRWLIKDLSPRVGLIGAYEKVALVRELMQSADYQEYLGIEGFSDYVGIPQRFACDAPEAVLDQLAHQLSTATADVFLVGIGHVKSYVLEALPRMHSALYIDVGSGLDALAGVVDDQRPYFAAWSNFRLTDPSLYADIDYLQVSTLRHVVVTE